MMNTGCTQKDLVDLKKSEIQDGYIIRKRSKTTKEIGVPVVKYKLWQETRQLLMASLSKDMILVFDCNETAITYQIILIQKKLGLPSRKVKLIRKTSSTILKNSHFGHLQDLFLGHAPRGMADKHYTGEVSLDDAIDYLGKCYNLTP